MTWWIWVLLGLVLLAAELATPGGFFAIFFGLAALVVGVLVWLEWVVDPPVQWLLFSVVSILGIGVFRRPLMRALKLDQPMKAVDSIQGEDAIVVEEVAPGGTGKAELRGASWTARTDGSETLAKGQRCKVARVEGLTLWLKA